MGKIVSHYLILPNRILSYAKIIYFTLTSVQTFLFLLCAVHGRTHVRRNPYVAYKAEMNIYAPFQVIVFYRIKTRNRSACDCLIRLCIRVWSLDGRSISVQTTSSGAQLMTFIWLFKCWRASSVVRKSPSDMPERAFPCSQTGFLAVRKSLFRIAELPFPMSCLCNMLIYNWLYQCA